jgi:hypothetical protein
VNSLKKTNSEQEKNRRIDLHLRYQAKAINPIIHSFDFPYERLHITVYTYLNNCRGAVTANSAAYMWVSNTRTLRSQQLILFRCKVQIWSRRAIGLTTKRHDVWWALLLVILGSYKLDRKSDYPQIPKAATDRPPSTFSQALSKSSCNLFLQLYYSWQNRSRLQLVGYISASLRPVEDALKLRKPKNHHNKNTFLGLQHSTTDHQRHNIWRHNAER